MRSRLTVGALLILAAGLVAAGPGSAGGTVRYADPGAGIAVVYPASWRRLAPPFTRLRFPVDRLLLTSRPALSGGDCSPDRAERTLAADGALIYLFEYRLPAGRGRRLRRSDFPPQPAHFTLRPSQLGSYECWQVPSYLLRFRAADRPFQVHVALGAHASAARRAQVLAILDSLRVSPLTPPPPDPFAGSRSQRASKPSPAATASRSG